MNDTKYNGWTNYATWRVNLEIFDGWSSEHIESLTMQRTVTQERLAIEIEDYARGLIEEQSQGLAFDYANAFLSEVNWHEIAKSMLESV